MRFLNLRKSGPFSSRHNSTEMSGIDGGDIEKPQYEELSVHGDRVTLGGYDLLEPLGTGRYGRVYLAREKNTLNLVALKIIKKEFLERQGKIKYALNERNALKEISHPFIITLYSSFQTKSQLCFSLEYAPGGELFDYIGKLSYETIKLYIAELTLALEHIHSLGLVYRDLKPENILIDGDNHVKLADFGTTKVVKNKLAKSYCGTCDYLAPEIVLHKPYGIQVDWWALGVLLYELLFKKTPFYAIDQRRMLNKIAEKNPIMPPCDTAAASLINGLLRKDPAKRYSFKDIITHEFFSDIDFEEVFQRKYKPSLKYEASKHQIQNQHEDYITWANDTSCKYLPNFTYDKRSISLPYIQKFTTVEYK